MIDDEEVKKTTIRYRRMKLAVPPSGPEGFVRRSCRTYKSKAENYVDVDEDFEISGFQKLQVSTLRKYKRVFKVPTPPNCSKSRLATIMNEHCIKSLFLLPDHEIIAYFIHFVKTRPDESMNKELGRKSI